MLLNETHNLAPRGFIRNKRWLWIWCGMRWSPKKFKVFMWQVSTSGFSVGSQSKCMPSHKGNVLIVLDITETIKHCLRDSKGFLERSGRLTSSVCVRQISFDVQLQIQSITWRFEKRKWMSIDIYNFFPEMSPQFSWRVVRVISISKVSIEMWFFFLHKSHDTSKSKFCVSIDMQFIFV